MTEFPPFRKILSVEARPGYRLALGWGGGRESIVDLSDMISRGGVFSALSDKDKFAAVQVGEKGRLVQWPEPKDDLGHPMIEIDSAALAYKIHQQFDSNLLETVKSALNAIGRKAPRSVASANSK
jgi:hypothetical protein